MTPTPLRYWQHGVFAFFYVLAVVLFLPRSFSEADDPGIAFLLREGVQVPFISPMLSMKLSWLYQHVSQDISFYALYLYGALALSLTVILHILDTRLVETPRLKRIILGVFLLFFPVFISHITFTFASILLSYAAIFGLITAVTKRSHPIYPLAFGTLFAMSYATRTEGFLVAPVFLLPVFVWLLVFEKSRVLEFFNTHKRCLILFLLPLITVMTLDNTGWFNNPDDADYYRHIKALGKVMAVPGFIEVATGDPVVVEKTGWRETDVMMLNSWLFYDEDKFSLQNLAVLNQRMNTRYLPLLLEAIQPATLLDQIRFTLTHWIRHLQISFLFLSTFLFLSCLHRTSPNAQRWFPLYFLLALFAECVAMVIFMRLPGRVTLPVFYMSAFTFFLYPGFLSADFSSNLLDRYRTDFSKNLAKKITVLLVVTLLIVGTGAMVRKTYLVPLKDRQALSENIAYLNALAGETGYILRTPGHLKLEAIDPLSANSLPRTDIGPGWLTFSRPYYRELGKRGLHQGKELLPWALRHDNAFLLAAPETLPVVKTFIQNTYGETPQITESGALPAKPKTSIYRLK